MHDRSLPPSVLVLLQPFTYSSHDIVNKLLKVAVITQQPNPVLCIHIQASL
jgi:hypothetical protein